MASGIGCFGKCFGEFTEGSDVFAFQNDCKPPKRGDAVCLQCAVVCEFGRLRQPLMSGLVKAADAIDALFGDGTFQPGRTLPRLYFRLWKEVLPCVEELRSEIVAPAPAHRIAFAPWGTVHGRGIWQCMKRQHSA